MRKWPKHVDCFPLVALESGLALIHLRYPEEIRRDFDCADFVVAAWSIFICPLVLKYCSMLPLPSSEEVLSFLCFFTKH